VACLGGVVHFDPPQLPHRAETVFVQSSPPCYPPGLLLFEFGVWNTIDNVVKRTLPPEDFKNKVVDWCIKRLPFFVGTKYRDVVLRCLTCADADFEESESSLDVLYWSVVRELE
jgi:hypothetical protein